MKKICLLDMDGVLVDFTKGAHKLHGIDYSEDDWPYDYNDYNYIPFANISEENFWKQMGRTFWRELEWTAEGVDILNLYERIFGTENIYLLTSPCQTPGCIEGKKDWILNHTTKYISRTVFTNCKEVCASPRAVLVDDSQREVNKFLRAGGEAILVPRPWNPMVNVPTFRYVRYQMEMDKIQNA